MQENRRYDEDQEVSEFASWVIIIVFSACIVAFGYLVYRVIPDTPRSWNFGQLGDTPAATVFSTEEPRPGGKLQRQVPMRPGAYRQNPLPAELQRREDQP